MAPVAEPGAHVSAHLSEADESNVHECSFTLTPSTKLTHAITDVYPQTARDRYWQCALALQTHRHDQVPECQVRVGAELGDSRQSGGFKIGRAACRETEEASEHA